MRNGRLTPTVVELLVLVSLLAWHLTVPNVAANPVIPLPIGGPPPLFPTTDIYINGDQDFPAESQYVKGSGTDEDPYRIENLVFSRERDVSIIAENTTKPLTIRNVTIRPFSYDTSIGIQLWDCRNVMIEDCRIESVGRGISISHSGNITISDCSINGNGDGGIGVDKSSSLTIVGNSVTRCFYGIWLRSTLNSEVSQNAVSHASGGIRLLNCEGVIIGENAVSSCDTPYFDDQPSLNTWPDSQQVASTDFGQLLLLGVAIPACAAMLAGTAILRRMRDKNAIKN